MACRLVRLSDSSSCGFGPFGWVFGARSAVLFGFVLGAGDERLALYGSLSEALSEASRRCADRVFSVVLRESGEALVYDRMLSMASAHEQPFINRCFDVRIDIDEMVSACRRVLSRQLPEEHACFFFAASVICLVSSATLPDLSGVASVVSDEEPHRHVAFLCDLLWQRGRVPFAQMLDRYEAGLVARLAGFGYLLYAELPCGYDLPMPDGSLYRLDERHVVVVFDDDRGRHCVVDDAGIRFVDDETFDGFGVVDTEHEDFLACYHGHMLVGVLLGVEGMAVRRYGAAELCDMALSAKHEVAISAVSGDVVNVSGDERSMRLVRTGIDVDVDSSNARLEVLAYCMDSRDLLSLPKNYLHVKPGLGRVGVDVVDFSGQRQVEKSFCDGKNISPIGGSSSSGFVRETEHGISFG